MQRKIAKIGPSTLMVSLPSKWCKENNIKKGDEIEVSSGENNSLIIGASQPERKLKEITLDLSKFRYYPRHLVATAYKVGYDKIIAKYSSEKEKRDVENLLSFTCLGYSILEETKDTLIIKEIAEIDDKEFEPVLRKVFFLMNEIARNSLEFVRLGNQDKLNEVLSQRKTLHKYTDFCRRIINKGITINYPYSAYLFLIIVIIEELTRAYRDVCLILSNKEHIKGYYSEDWWSSPVKEKGRTIDSEYFKFLEKINQQVYLFSSIFFNPKLEKIDEFYSNNLILAERIEKIIKSPKKGKDALILVYFLLILDALRRLRGALLSLNM